MAKPLLISLLPSADVDLGRWLLSHYGVTYTERPHAPIFHVLALKFWGVGADDYPLFMREGEKYGGIDKLLPMLEAEATSALKLLPDQDREAALYQEVHDLEHYARWDMGEAVVNWSYWNLLKYKSVVWPSITTDVPWYEKLTCLLAFRVIRALMYKGLKLDQAAADAALQKIYAGWDKFDQILSDGRSYLVGERLTFADLALATSGGPMILAQGYHGMLPNHALCPVFMLKVYQDLRQRPTGRFIQRIYDDHRASQLLCVKPGLLS